MSIAPFLPGLLAPAPASSEAGTTTGAEGEAAFMDALAAALAVQPMVAPAPTVPTAPAADVVTAPLAEVVAAPLAEIVAAPLAEVVAAPLVQVVAAPLVQVVAAPLVEEVAQQPSRDPLPLPALDAPETQVSQTQTQAPQAWGLETPRSTLLHRSPALVEEVAPQPSRDPLRAAPVGGLETGHETALLDQRPVSMPAASVTMTSAAPAVTPAVPAAATPVERAVVAQVFPEVTRLASSGNGTHRITLTLQPAQLGEVRVTLVVRDGAVRVRMSGEAGDSAVRQALASGAPELQRMLERAGATEARVLVRDTNAAFQATVPTPAARNDFAQAWSGQPDQQFGQQSGQPHGFDQPGQSRGEGRDGHPGRPGHPNESGARRAAAADVVPGSTPTPGRLDRNL